MEHNRFVSTEHTNFLRGNRVGELRERESVIAGPPPELLIDDCEESDEALVLAIPLLRVADEYLGTPVGSDAALVKLDELLTLVRRQRDALGPKR